jgi:hypothetical protein
MATVFASAVVSQTSPSSLAIASSKNAWYLASAQVLGSRRLHSLGAAHFPPLQLNNVSHAGGTLLGVSQRKGEKERSSFGGARRMNAAAQTVGQLANDRKPSTPPDRLRYRSIVGDLAPYDFACKHQLHSQLGLPIAELRMSRYIGQQFRYDQPEFPATPTFKPQLIR